jgi:hypothetical protein
MYQNSRKHDVSNYWPAIRTSLPAVQQRTRAHSGAGQYYLPAIKIVADIGKTQLISNTSYYNRDEKTGYQGSSYDFAYYQSQSWLIGSCGSASTTPVPPCSWYPLIDAKGVHLPAGFAGYATPNVITNQQETWTQEIRWQSNDDASRWKWTMARSGRCRRKPASRSLQDKQILSFWNALFAIDPRDYFGGDFTAATASARRKAFRIATFTTTTTGFTTGSSRDSAKPRIPSPINGN